LKNKKDLLFRHKQDFLFERTILFSELKSFLMLTKNEIRIWRMRKSADISYLTESEISFSERYVSPDSKAAYLKGRFGVRAFASLYASLAPSDVKIEISKSGKPFFANIEDLHFNISHSGSEVAIAFSTKPVGFDMELLDRKRDFRAIADRFFTNEESSEVKSAEEYGNELFVRIWTAKEAMLKLSGEGLAGGLNRAMALSEREGRLADQQIHLSRLSWEGVIGCVASFDPISEVKIEVH
jgi:4'-phosphopantetheinyl transferase